MARLHFCYDWRFICVSWFRVRSSRAADSAVVLSTAGLPLRNYMAGVSGHGSDRPTINLLVSISDGSEFGVSKKLYEETTHPLLACNQEVLATITWLLRRLVYVRLASHRF